MATGPWRSILSDESDEKKTAKRTWQPPTLTLVGTMQDILLGGGKSGSNADMDPGANFKGGMG